MQHISTIKNITYATSYTTRIPRKNTITYKNKSPCLIKPYKIQKFPLRLQPKGSPFTNRQI